MLLHHPFRTTNDALFLLFNGSQLPARTDPTAEVACRCARYVTRLQAYTILSDHRPGVCTVRTRWHRQHALYIHAEIILHDPSSSPYPRSRRRPHPGLTRETTASPPATRAQRADSAPPLPANIRRGCVRVRAFVVERQLLL